MSFFNEVEYEAKKTLPDGVEVIVKAKASETSSISFEDAWLKAQEQAKKDAEAKLAELVKKIEEKDKTTEIIIKGMKGDIGYPGCKGRTGPMGPTGPAGKDLTRIKTIVTNPLTLTKEANTILKQLIALSPTSSRSVKATTTPITSEQVTNLQTKFECIFKDKLATFDPDTATTTITAGTGQEEGIAIQLSAYLCENDAELKLAVAAGFSQFEETCQSDPSETKLECGLYAIFFGVVLLIFKNIKDSSDT